MSILAQERVNPYVGLPPFESTDSLYFFGRERQTAELMDRLRHTRLLAVLGSSGCGKSSLVRAGLIPALRAGFMMQERDVWQIAKMKPGRAPLRHLAAALLADDGPPAADVAALMEKLEIYGADAVEELLGPRLGSRASLLLLLDQFEEIFSVGRHAQPTPEAEDFVALILDLAARTRLPVFTVITMRSDFLGDCEVFPGLPEAMSRSCYVVPRLVREQMQEAIQGPALLKGTKLAPRLLDQLLNDASNRADQLPVLQHALSRTWQIWSDRGATGEIRRKDYDDAGTVEKAISKHANAALTGLDERQVARVFRCLVDTDPSGRRVRKGSTLGDIVAITRSPIADVQTILERFRADERYFVVVESDGPPEARRVDISHESLIRQWEKLSKWTDDEREDRDRLLEYVKRARRWTDAGDAGNAVLLRDLDLTIARRWRVEFMRAAPWASRYVSAEDFERALAFIASSEANRLRAVRNRSLMIMGLLAAALGLVWLSIRQQEAAKSAKANEARAKTDEARAKTQAEAEAGKRRDAEAARAVAEALAQEQAGEIKIRKDIDERTAAVDALSDKIQQASKRAAAGDRTSVLREIRVAADDLAKLMDKYQVDAKNAPWLEPVVKKAGMTAAAGRIEEGRSADLSGNLDAAEKAYSTAAAAAAASQWLELLGTAEEGLGDVAEHRHGDKVWEATKTDSIRKHYAKARDAYQRAGKVAGAVRARQEVTRLTPWGYIVDIGTGEPGSGGTIWVLDDRHDRVIIGRWTPGTVAADLPIQSQDISRLHAVIIRNPKAKIEVTIEDMRSSFGSMLHDRCLEYGEAQPLQDGDVFTLAVDDVPHELQFRRTLPDEKSRPRFNGAKVDEPCGERLRGQQRTLQQPLAPNR
jgi:hypothetical protein